MKTFLVTLLGIYASTEASRLTDKRSIISTNNVGSQYSGLYTSNHGSYGSSAWTGSAGWTGHSYPSGLVPGFASGFGSNHAHGLHPPAEINTYIQPTKIITKIIKVPVAVPHPIPVKVKYPVFVPQVVRVEVDRPVPVPVPHPVPVYINKPYPVNINRPVPVYITKPVAVPVTVGHDAESSGLRGSNSQYGAPVLEQSSSGGFASAVAQSFLDNSGDQAHQSHDTQQFSSSYASSFAHSESGPQASQLGYNYAAPPKAWN